MLKPANSGAYSGIFPGGEGFKFFFCPGGGSAPVGTWKPPDIDFIGPGGEA